MNRREYFHEQGYIVNHFGTLYKALGPKRRYMNLMTMHSNATLE